jgi:hypothetical protein
MKKITEQIYLVGAKVEKKKGTLKSSYTSIEIITKAGDKVSGPLLMTVVSYLSKVHFHFIYKYGGRF